MNVPGVISPLLFLGESIGKMFLGTIHRGGRSVRKTLSTTNFGFLIQQ